MSGRQLARLAGALVLVLVLWGVLSLTRHARTDRPVGLALPRVDTAAVDTIAFTTPTDSAIVTRGAGARWLVNGFPAATSHVQQLLRALDDTTNRSELAAESRSARAALGVTADGGQRVRVVARGRTVLELITGHHTTDAEGIYARQPFDSAVFALHGPLSQALGRAIGNWRDRTIVSVAPDSVQRAVLRRAGRSYAVVRSGSAWKVAPSGAADSQAVRQWLARFDPASATGFATAAQADSARFAHPTARVQLVDAAGHPLASLVFDSTKSALWARADTTRTVYRLDPWMLGQLVPAERTLIPHRAAGTARPHPGRAARAGRR